MQFRICLVVLVSLLGVSCEPFLISPFPGFLPDVQAALDLSGEIEGDQVERYSCFTLDNGTVEHVFLIAYYYSGTRRVWAYSADDLALVFQMAESGGLGSRHFVDLAGDYIVGTYRLPIPGTVGSIGTGYGPDGFGAVVNGRNTLIDSFGMGLNLHYYDGDWNSLNDATIAYIEYVTTESFKLVTVRSFVSLDLSAYSPGVIGPAAVFVFRNEDWDSGTPGFAVVVLGEPGTSLIGGTGGYSFFFPLGPMGEEAWVMSEGVVYRTREGAIRLRTWNGTDIANTRNLPLEHRAFMDYGNRDFYYVFDPASLKLYKARNWWMK